MPGLQPQASGLTLAQLLGVLRPPPQSALETSGMGAVTPVPGFGGQATEDAERAGQAFNAAGGGAAGTRATMRDPQSGIEMAMGMAGPATIKGVGAIPLSTIRAFHGSPHDFDAFKMPGNGRALHFTDNEGLASSPRYQGGNGTVYEVNLKAHPDEMLNLDANLSQQSPAVQGKLNDLGVTDLQKSGFEIQGDLGPKKLNEAGIPGAHRDAFGSKTYLMFDPDRVEIAAKNGEPMSGNK
jgi:hypothetical protein